jgi:hypothetical protein
MWIVIAVVIVAVILLVAAVVSVLGRLSGLRRAMLRLHRWQQEATQVQAATAEVERTLIALRERAEEAERRVAVIKAARGGD